MFVVVGDPASGGSTAPGLLPGFWHAISQLLPPGAGTTAMRDVVYFHAHGTTHAIVVLGAYAVIGFVAGIVITRLKAAAAARAPAQPA